MSAVSPSTASIHSSNRITSPNQTSPSRFSKFISSINPFSKPTPFQERTITVLSSNDVTIHQELTNCLQEIEKKLGGLPQNCPKLDANLSEGEYITIVRNISISIETYLRLQSDFDSKSAEVELSKIENLMRKQLGIFQSFRYSHEFESELKLLQAEYPVLYENASNKKRWIDDVKLGAARGAALTSLIVNQFWGKTSGSNLSNLMASIFKFFLKPILVGIGLLHGSKTNLLMLSGLAVLTAWAMISWPLVLSQTALTAATLIATHGPSVYLVSTVILKFIESISFNPISSPIQRTVPEESKPQSQVPNPVPSPSGIPNAPPANTGANQNPAQVHPLNPVPNNPAPAAAQAKKPFHAPSPSLPNPITIPAAPPLIIGASAPPPPPMSSPTQNTNIKAEVPPQTEKASSQATNESAKPPKSQDPSERLKAVIENPNRDMSLDETEQLFQLMTASPSKGE